MIDVVVILIAVLGLIVTLMVKIDGDEVEIVENKRIEESLPHKGEVSIDKGSISLVEITDLGEMFMFNPPIGSSGTIHMELYERGKEMLAEFALPHDGKPIQIWLACSIKKDKPESYYLRYTFGPEKPSTKWRRVYLNQMPRTKK